MNKTEITIPVDNDFLTYNDEGELVNKPFYCVRYTQFYPYKDRDNYLCYREEHDYLQSESINRLYEQMGHLVVNHMIHAEKESKNDPWGHPRDEFKVEFSNIYIEVENYNEEKMKNSEAYRNIGAAKEKARIQELEEKAREEKRRKEWLAADQERRDREEFERLSKKYNKV